MRRPRGSKADATGRSKGGGGGQWWKVHRYMLKSAAWAALTPHERSVYFALLLGYDGFNNGRIGFGVRGIAEAAGVNKDTVTKALARLEALGFIRCIREGGFSYKMRHTAEWLLTAYDDDRSGHPASKDFMSWRPTEEKHGPTRPDSRSDQTGPSPAKAAASVRPDRTVEGV